MRLSELSPEAFKIDMIRTGEGACPENCKYCAAWEPTKVRDVTRSQIRRALHFMVDRSRNMRVGDWLAEYPTTDVNKEPLRADSANASAEEVHDFEKNPSLSLPPSNLVFNTHGVSFVMSEGGIYVPNQNMSKRLLRTVELGRKGEIPLLALTVDTQRQNGKVDYNVNKQGYIETLRLARPFLAEKLGRFTVSIQGDDEKASITSRTRAFNMYEEILKDSHHGLTEEEKSRINLDLGRPIVRAGKAAKYSHISPYGECAVIPDQKFVEEILPKMNTIRGRLRFVFGAKCKDPKIVVEYQANEPHKTYNTSVAEAWHLFDEFKSPRKLY